jgi:putative transposase
LKEPEAGVSVADLCRRYGVSDASIYKWKAKFGGMEVSEAKRLKTLEDENTRLKLLLADAMLDNAAKDLLGKKMATPAAGRGFRYAVTSSSVILTATDSTLWFRQCCRYRDGFQRCPSADNLRLFRRFAKRGSGSSGLEFRRPAADAASVGLR